MRITSTAICGSLMNRSITIHTGQCDEAPQGYDIFLNKEDECVKVVLKP